MTVTQVRSRILLMIGVFCLHAWSCGEDSVEPIKSTSFEGILETNTQCTILGGDTTDFLPRPLTGPANYSLKWACPNPALGKVTSIHLQLPQPDSVWIYIYDRPGRSPIDTLYNRILPAGTHSHSWKHDGPAGIYRIKMYTGSGFTSYGDVQLEN